MITGCCQQSLAGGKSNEIACLKQYAFVSTPAPTLIDASLEGSCLLDWDDHGGECMKQSYMQP